MLVRSIFSTITKYIRSNHLNLLVVILFSVFGVIQVSQSVAIGVVYKDTVGNTQMLEQTKIHNEEMINKLTNKLMGIIEEYDVNNLNRLESLEHKLGERIDINSNSIDPDDKRGILVKKVKKLIVENTNTIISGRDVGRIADAVIKYSNKYNLSVVKVLAQIKQESNFNKNAISKAGARGLMQIMPATERDIEGLEGHKFNYKNIYNNIEMGCIYMEYQLRDFDNSYDDALQAYNRGPTSTAKYIAGEISYIPEETVGYIENIHRWIKVFEQYGIE